MTTFYVHVHDGKGNHADGQTYSIANLCEYHFHKVVNDPTVEFVAEDVEEHCDRCDEGCAGCLTATMQHPCRRHGCSSRCLDHKSEWAR